MDHNPLGFEYRLVSDGQRAGQPVRIVSGARSFTTEVEDLWDAVTNAERISRWFLPITGDLKLGGRYQLEGHAGGEITRCDRPEVLEVTWECSENVSWVTLRIEPEGDRTRLTLEHTMTKDEAGEAHWKQFGPGATGVGWELGVFGLGLYLDGDIEAYDRRETEAWMTSEPGKDFIRACANAWSVAHVSCGEVADVANAMAEQTAKAYTGD